MMPIKQSIKIFHLSDLHIGLRLVNRDLSEDQRYIFNQIAALAKEEMPDAIVIAGDIYDKAVPSAEAVELFDDFVMRLRGAAPDAEIMMISGNHDSAMRLNVFRNILKDQKIRMIGLPPQKEEEHIEKVTLHDEHGPVHFYLLPFVKPAMIRLLTGSDENGNLLSYDMAVRKLLAREEIDTSARNILVSHQFYLPSGQDAAEVERADSEIKTVGNIDAVASDVLAPFDYAALGHIHKPMTTGGEYFRYCGSPMALSMSEAGQQKGIVCVELAEKGSISVRTLPLHPFREMRILKGELSDVLREACSDYVSVRLTDREDLDVTDMNDRLRLAFPNLLEIRRELYFKADYRTEETSDEDLDPFSLCTAFLGAPDEEEKAILRDVINKVAEAGR